MRKDLVIGLSLANLCLIGIWADLLPFLYLSEGYPIGAFPCPRDFGAVALNVLWLTPVFGVLGWQARKLRGPALTVARLVFLAVLAVALNAMRMHFNTWPERVWNALPPGVTVSAGLLAGVVALVIVWQWNRALMKGAQAALLIMTPLAPVMLAQAAWATTSVQCGEAAELAPEQPVSGSAPRVVWIIFDELEQRALFEQRPPGVELPAFDRLRAESVSASHAQAPGRDTERSIPAFLTGRPVAKALVTGPNRLLIEFEGSSSQEALGSQPHLFSSARALGFNTAVAGWFIPYCSFLAADLNACSWEPCVTCGRRVGTFGSTLGESLVNQLSELGPRHGPRHHVESYRQIRAHALELAADPRFGLVFLHFPVPHDPWIYDGASHELRWLRRGGRGYFDNLVLADDTLADVRRAMEQAGLWDRSSVLVLGDHGWRQPGGFDGGRVDHRVPLILKLAGETTGASFDPPVAALVVHDLTLKILKGDVRSKADVMSALARSASIGVATSSGESSPGR